MDYSDLWCKTTASKDIASKILNKHRHSFKWKKDKENILEIGCGDGSLTKTVLYPFVEDHVKKLVAIDKLDYMCNYAKAKNAMEGIEYLIKNAMDADYVREMKGKFDHIFAIFVAHWIPDTKLFFENIRKMLKPNGQVFMVFLNENAVKISFTKQMEEKAWAKYTPLKQVCAEYTEKPEQYIKELLRNTGFEVDVYEREISSITIENFTDFLKPLIQMYDDLHLIPSELQEDFVQYHLRNCREVCTYLGEPDVYLQPYEMTTCLATKISM